MGKFHEVALKDANKSEEQILSEKVSEFLEVAVIDCEVQINNAESEAKKLETSKRKTEKSLEKAKASFDETRFQHATTFKAYVERRNRLKSEISSLEKELEATNEKLDTIASEVAEWKSVLADLNS